jgi:hypothetical protein
MIMDKTHLVYDSDEWVNGFWIYDYIIYGWRIYYINFMFESFYGPLPAIVAQMHTAIEKEFYAPFICRFSRDPTRKSQQDKLPKLWLFPDLPVYKRAKQQRARIEDVKFNAGGLHFNGPLLIPPFSRFKGCPIQHINEKQSNYARRGIRRIHVTQAPRVPGMIDYAFKTIKSGRADLDYVLILPKSFSEVRRTGTMLRPADRLKKEIQSRFNLSDEVAANYPSDKIHS